MIERLEVLPGAPDPNPALVAVTDGSVNLRGGPGTAYPKVATAAAGLQLELVGRYKEWFKVRTTEGKTAWVSSEVLPVSAYLARRVPTARDIPALPRPQSTVAAASGRGGSAPPLSAAQAGNVVSFAMQFVGTSYVWGGSRPGAFDCSGYTKYVYGQFGLSLPHSAAGQYSQRYGTFIDKANLQPGDIVFFANTYKRGISHVGIYVGGGMVVQALAEGVPLSAVSMIQWLLAVEILRGDSTTPLTRSLTMRNRHRDNRTTRSTPFRLAAALVLVILTATVAGSHAAGAHARVADFAPPLDQAAAAARVAAAQSAERQVRQEILPVAPIEATRLPLLPTLYFEQTEHHLSNRAGFLDFWRANGQVLLFGYPVSEELVEGGRIVQYFERARFEFHPELIGQPGQVQLGLIGRELTVARSEPAFLPVAAPQDSAAYFPETGHTLRGEFQHFWERRGGLAAFGFPISEPFDEQGQLVQYFERARFSHNPGDMEPFYRSMEQANGINLDTLYEVQLSHLGRDRADMGGVNTAAVSPLAGVRAWSPVRWERRIEVDLSAQWLTAYEGDLVVYRAPVATGRDGFNTPTGSYAIYDRLRVQTMVGDAGGESWYVPDVPWVQYVVGGVALHGTYWHDRFGTGTRMSHGCINLDLDDARWLYEWADIGTTVHIFYS